MHVPARGVYGVRAAVYNTRQIKCEFLTQAAMTRALFSAWLHSCENAASTFTCTIKRQREITAAALAGMPPSRNVNFHVTLLLIFLMVNFFRGPFVCAVNFVLEENVDIVSLSILLSHVNF